MCVCVCVCVCYFWVKFIGDIFVFVILHGTLLFSTLYNEISYPCGVYILYLFGKTAVLESLPCCMQCVRPAWLFYYNLECSGVEGGCMYMVTESKKESIKKYLKKFQSKNKQRSLYMGVFSSLSNEINYISKESKV